MSPEDRSPSQDFASNPYAAPLAEESERPFDPTLTGTTLNPWVSIWTQPRATIRQIVDTNPRYMLMPIVLAMGLSTGLSGAADSVTDPDLQSFQFAAAGAALGAVVGGLIIMPLLWLLNSWLISITARWIGGQATLAEIRAAYAWGSVPGIFTIPLSLVVIILATQLAPTQLMGLVAINGLVEGVLGVWTFVVLCKCIGEVSLFSAWKGWGAMILAGLLLVVPLVLVGLIVVAAVAAM